jgi:molybdate transport system ATP-binding protein
MGTTPALCFPALARALVKAPRLLILDEPCQGLDAPHRELLVKTVDRLISAGSVTAIYVTHRNDEIPSSISRVLRLAKGRATLETPERPKVPCPRHPRNPR